MLVRELLYRIPNEKILLLQCAGNRKCQALAMAVLQTRNGRTQLLKRLYDAAKEYAVIINCVDGKQELYTREVAVPTIWLVASEIPQLMKEHYDVEIALKPVSVTARVPGGIEWIQGVGEQPHFDTRVLADMSRWAGNVYRYTADRILAHCDYLLEQEGRDIERLQKSLRSCKETLQDWPTKYSLLEIENAQLRRDNRQLAEYIALLQTSMNEPESVPEEVQDSDLTGYTIKVCTTRPHMKIFEWECFDIDAYPTAVENCDKCDLVIIDTKHISHSAFWKVRDYCSNRGIRYVYTPYHNKDRLRKLALDALHK